MKTVIPKVIFIICTAVVLTFNAQANSEARLTTQELQWTLAVPDTEWTDTVKGVARLLEDKKYTAADAFLNEALTKDFEQTLFSLPFFENFIYRYEQHDITPVFVSHLRVFPGEQRLHILSLFNLDNKVVRDTGINVLADWWQEDRTAMSAWLQSTGGFFEDIYLETLSEKVLKTPDDFRDLADVYYSLSDNDERRQKYFTQVIEYWVENDWQQSVDYLNSLHTKLAGKGDRAFDRAAMTIGYRLISQNKLMDALNWAAKIKQADIREWMVRDFSADLTKDQDKQLLLNWMTKHPIETEDAKHEIEQHLQSSNVADSSGEEQ